MVPVDDVVSLMLNLDHQFSELYIQGWPSL